ncbi:TPA: hypothetical protein ACN3ZQ_003733 [Vibrio cholerae]|nr:hypothetical protein [Vibrio cholerae]HAS8321961.1 hypothetical protein [Vibrio vulnificus]
MLNHFKTVVYGFSLFPRQVGFEFVGKLALLGAVFRTPILWRWKFSELPHSISGKHDVMTGGSIGNLVLGFFVLAAKVQSLIFKIMSHFSFWLLRFCS